MGEIDGAPRTQAEAIEFLRMKTEEARQMMAGREQNWIPHPTTYYHQSRYLRPQIDRIPEMPKRLISCVNILAKYPTSPKIEVIRQNLNAFLPAFVAIDKALERMEGHQPPLNCARRLESRTELYAMAVREWPKEDLKFVPNAAKWFEECRYDQPEQSWQRKPVNGFEQERQQIQRLVN
jgi:hypothetical protein